MIWKAALLVVWMSLMAAASGALAAVIPVVNGSFETLPGGGLPNGCGTGCSYSNNDLGLGWSGTSSFGQFRPGPASVNFTYFNSVPDGVTVAYSNGGSLSQTVAATAVTGVAYTLSVDIGYRKDIPDNGTFELVVGLNTIASSPITSQLSGNWVTDTIVYTATAADAGAQISIVLSSPGAQGDWDNVRLSDNTTPVPEPTGLALLGTALAALSVLRRRARPRSNSRALSQD